MRKPLPRPNPTPEPSPPLKQHGMRLGHPSLQSWDGSLLCSCQAFNERLCSSSRSHILGQACANLDLVLVHALKTHTYVNAMSTFHMVLQGSQSPFQIMLHVEVAADKPYRMKFVWAERHQVRYQRYSINICKAIEQGSRDSLLHTFQINYHG